MIAYGGSYISFPLITEIGFDGILLCGIELELPQLELVIPRHRYFFWTAVSTSISTAYEESALQAVIFLSRFYKLSLP